ncbi:hypothetical protein SK128_007472 [Halocaridina rubra]|uniref:Uncharacterized protein n=1 Tax=Halocaridina rubra TaxID=373956 RepID=A0AAN8WQ18_HALRR
MRKNYIGTTPAFCRESALLTELYILNCLQYLVWEKAMGPDGIHPKLLHECHEKLALPVAFIVNSSVNTGETLSLENR